MAFIPIALLRLGFDSSVQAGTYWPILVLVGSVVVAAGLILLDVVRKLQFVMNCFENDEDDFAAIRAHLPSITSRVHSLHPMLFIAPALTLAVVGGVVLLSASDYPFYYKAPLCVVLFTVCVVIYANLKALSAQDGLFSVTTEHESFFSPFERLLALWCLCLAITLCLIANFLPTPDSYTPFIFWHFIVAACVVVGVLFTCRQELQINKWIKST